MKWFEVSYILTTKYKLYIVIKFFFAFYLITLVEMGTEKPKAGSKSEVSNFLAEFIKFSLKYLCLVRIIN